MAYIERIRRAAKAEHLVHTIETRAARAGYCDPGEIARILRHMAREIDWRGYADAELDDARGCDRDVRGAGTEGGGVMGWPVIVELDGWQIAFYPRFGDTDAFMCLRADGERFDRFGEWSTGSGEGGGSVLEIDPDLDAMIPDDVRDPLMRAAIEAGGGLVGETFSRRF